MGELGVLAAGTAWLFVVKIQAKFEPYPGAVSQSGVYGYRILDKSTTRFFSNKLYE